jgi:hypothetical protein
LEKIDERNQIQHAVEGRGVSEMTVNSVYLVLTGSSDFCYRNAEELFLEKQLIMEEAWDTGKRLNVEFIFVKHPQTRKEQRRRYRLLTLVQGGKFDRVVFRGDTFTPYVGALRTAAYPDTEVLNQAEKNSTLDFFLQMFDYDRERSALE